MGRLGDFTMYIVLTQDDNLGRLGNFMTDMCPAFLTYASHKELQHHGSSLGDNPLVEQADNVVPSKEIFLTKARKTKRYMFRFFDSADGLAL